MDLLLCAEPVFNTFIIQPATAVGKAVYEDLIIESRFSGIRSSENGREQTAGR